MARMWTARESLIKLGAHAMHNTARIDRTVLNDMRAWAHAELDNISQCMPNTIESQYYLKCTDRAFETLITATIKEYKKLH